MTQDSQARQEPPTRPVGISCKKCGHFRQGLAAATPRMACPNCGAVYAKVEQALDAKLRQPSERPRPPMPAKQMWAAGVAGFFAFLSVVHVFDRHSDLHVVERLITMVMMVSVFAGLMFSRPGDQHARSGLRRFFGPLQKEPHPRRRIPIGKFLITAALLYAVGAAVWFGLLVGASKLWG